MSRSATPGARSSGLTKGFAAARPRPVSSATCRHAFRARGARRARGAIRCPRDASESPTGWPATRPARPRRCLQRRPRRPAPARPRAGARRARPTRVPCPARCCSSDSFQSSVLGLQFLVFSPRLSAGGASGLRLVFEEVNAVNDSDDGRINRRALLARGGGRGAPSLLHDEDEVAYSSVNRVEREQGRSPLRARGRDRLAEHHTRVLVALILLRRYDVADDARQDHVRLPFDTWPSESTMPMIVQSVGVSSRLKGKLASLPRHQKISSPTPAPMASSATSGWPCGCKSALSDCTTRSLRPSSESFFTVATTVPMTRASCMRAVSC